MTITPGKTLENPVTGERFTFTEVRPELLAFDFALREGGSVPIPHVHPVQAERFHVTHGSVRFRLGWRRVFGGAVVERRGERHRQQHPQPSRHSRLDG